MTQEDGRRAADRFSLIAESPAERQRRVAAIRRKVAVGEYEVPPEDVAAAVVSFFSRDAGPNGSVNPGDTSDTC